MDIIKTYEHNIYNKILLNEPQLIKIRNIIIDNESKVNGVGNDIYKGTNDNSLTGRYWCYNWLYTEIGDILIPKIKDILYKDLKIKCPVAIQCWANIFRKGEGITLHSHSPDWFCDVAVPENQSNREYVSANIFIDGDTEIGTHYLIGPKNKLLKRENTRGEISAFSSFLKHLVLPNYTEKKRISIGIDIHFINRKNIKKYHNEMRFIILQHDNDRTIDINRESSNGIEKRPMIDNDENETNEKDYLSYPPDNDRTIDIFRGSSNGIEKRPLIDNNKNDDDEFTVIENETNEEDYLSYPPLQ